MGAGHLRKASDSLRCLRASFFPAGVPYDDQWAFLSSLERLGRGSLEGLVADASDALDILNPVEEEQLRTPWAALPSRPAPPVVGPLPEELKVVLGNQIFVPKADLTPFLRNRLIRLAAFQNPEFYRAQAMRLSTFDKPRIISCCEDFPEHIGLPRGCMDELPRSSSTMLVSWQQQQPLGNPSLRPI